MSDSLRVALVGTGTVAQVVYLPLLQRRHDLFEVRALCDRSTTVVDAVGDRFGVAPAHRYTDVAALIGEERLDAVILLASGSHGALARALLDAGTAVLCEKPLAYTLREADALAGDGRLQLGYMKLCDPAVGKAREWMDRLGAVRAVEVSVLHPTMEAQLNHLRIPPVIDPHAGSSSTADVAALRWEALGPAAAHFGALYTDVLLGSLVHDLAVMRDLVGALVEIDFVEVWPEGVHPPSVEVSGRLAAGGRASLRWHFLPTRPTYRERIEVHGEAGSLTLEFPAPYLLHAPTAVRLETGASEEVLRRQFSSTVEAFETQLEAFHRLVTDDVRPPAGSAEGRAEIVTCQAMVRRLAAQRGVKLGGEAARP
jgi:myo-inositol 2-dehydrogenase / D-chiro-inositol 1-dehydrogenase